MLFFLLVELGVLREDVVRMPLNVFSAAENHARARHDAVGCTSNRGLACGLSCIPSYGNL
jgi:hypothetical protein